MDNHFKKVIIKKLSIIFALIVAMLVLTISFRADKNILEEKPETKEASEIIKKTVPNFPPVVIKNGNKVKTVVIPVND